MTAINTEVLAEPNSCREGAAYLTKLANANHEAGTALNKTRSESESAWEGAAAEAFREQATRAASDTDEVARIAHKVSRELTSFADNIATCKSRMERALDAAREGGLIVRGTWIEKPNGDPTQTASEGAGSPSMPGLDPTDQARKDRERRLDAWREAEDLVQWARRLENTAHEELNAALEDANALVASLTKGSTWLGNTVAVVGALHGAAKKLQGMAAERLAFVENFSRLSADSAMPAATRQAHMTKLMTSIGLTEAQAASNARALGNLGETKVGNILFNPLAKTFGGTKPGVVRTVGRMGGIAGFLLTGVESGRQIIVEGKPVGKTLSSNFASYGVGAGVGGAAALAAGAAGVAAAPVTVIGVGVGAGAAWLYSYSQENTWQDFQHDSKEVTKDVLDRHSKSQEQLHEVERKHPGSTPLTKW
ncbi:hypothetical protein EIL87_15350 [Saccharopolyspora rhizosphaerae]|uniref:Putative T7SS secretion signal domain-containing protein n=1 Tax=Saccharopolyspora rhizosphaerae TaxID=2492662 RepID=A0A426JQI3_9PSEU|nr:hypothetical protein [Saccharopolyspora rhizosphaerae]RRO15438.1 hypothetical protein EIL87_15350 [Saccharopolyspora rhizosphaerae]